MKQRTPSRGIALLMMLAPGFAAMAQITPVQLKQFISGKWTFAKKAMNDTAGVKEFYRQVNYEPAWVKKDNTADIDVLFTLLEHAAEKGLDRQDYQYGLVASFHRGTIKLENNTDSLEAETRITDAALHFFRDIVYGNSKPVFAYNGLNYVPSCYDIPMLLADNILKGRFHSFIDRLPAGLPEIAPLENKIKWLHVLISQPHFEEVIITSNKASSDNKLLMTKLYQLGILDTVATVFTDTLMKQKLKSAQELLGIEADGKLGNATMAALNITMAERYNRLCFSVNTYRWLNCLAQNQPVINVNIPAAYLKVYSGKKAILEMRVIVGKKTTTTPALASRVDEVVLYPYWHVPYRIATRELLPLIKRNPDFINTGNYQVLNAAGKIVNPHSVNWHAYSARYFPFLIRQSTGCDNALGLLKLNFYNPFGVYLHDTPTKNLFKKDRRFFSHGCMRMEKPMEIGHLVLAKNTIAIDTLEEKGCLRNQAPITVPANVRMPVIVWYNPAGIDAAGRVIFFEDIYGKFSGAGKQ